MLSVVMLFTLREPPRVGLSTSSAVTSPKTSLFKRIPYLLGLFFRPSILLLSLAGAVRNAAGYVWSYNTETYFMSIGQTPTEIGTYMSWIPMVSGSVGVLAGGFVSDRVVSRVGPHGRVWVIIISLLLAAPFVFCVLFLEPPWAYISLIPTYIIGETTRTEDGSKEVHFWTIHKALGRVTKRSHYVHCTAIEAKTAGERNSPNVKNVASFLGYLTEVI